MNKTENKNILNDFNDGIDLSSESASKRKEKENDPVRVSKLASGFLTIMNIMVFIIILLGSIYVYIQKNEEMLKVSYLTPVCKIMLGNIEHEGDCSSASALLKFQKEEVVKLKNMTTTEVIKLIPRIYNVNNFKYSNNVTVLLEKSKTRLKPLEIMEEFNNLKEEFASFGFDDQLIKCGAINITEEGILETRCEAYSKPWYDIKHNIIYTYDRTGEEEEKTVIPGTSISIAASFLDFLDEKPSNFELLGKQKSFTSTTDTEKGVFRKKTSFEIKLKYNSVNNLSF